MTRTLLLALIACLAAACTRPAPVEVHALPVASAAPTPAKPTVDYFNNGGRDDVLAAGLIDFLKDVDGGSF